MAIQPPSPQARQYLYGIITVAMPILVAYGIVDANQVVLWLALAGQVLATGTAAVAVAQQRKNGVLPAKPQDDGGTDQ